MKRKKLAPPPSARKYHQHSVEYKLSVFIELGECRWTNFVCSLLKTGSRATLN